MFILICSICRIESGIVDGKDIDKFKVPTLKMWRKIKFNCATHGGTDFDKTIYLCPDCSELEVIKLFTEANFDGF